MLHIIYGDVLAQADRRDRLASTRSFPVGPAGDRAHDIGRESGVVALQSLVVRVARDVTRSIVGTVRVRVLIVPKRALGIAGRTVLPSGSRER
jgi:hypothetical protein